MIWNGALLPHRFIPTGNRSGKAYTPKRLPTFHQNTLEYLSRPGSI
jgi:hypothetical protein